MNRARADEPAELVMSDDTVWTPDRGRGERSELASFLSWLGQREGHRFDDYLDAWNWSAKSPGDFWDALWQYEDILGERGNGPALADARMPGAQWFPGARVSYAEHLMRFAGSGPALIAVSQDGEPIGVSWPELIAEAGALAQTLRGLGVVRGDRVVAYANNIPQAVVAFIATASLGAVWSVCSPDFGTAGVVARFRQLTPKVLIAVDGYRFADKTYSRADEVAEIVTELGDDLDHVIWIDALERGSVAPVPALTWSEATAEPAPLTFERVPFDHPLWVLYSSGTTGTPKGIVQGHGGILLEHLKLLRLSFDVGEHDRFLVLASTSWMVWNTMVAGLLRGATVVLLDGNPLAENARRVWRVVAELGVSILGVGASFVHATMKAGVTPGTEFDTSSLREIVSTGSPLSPDAYDWVIERVGSDVWLNSSSGGTDVCSTFVGGCPLLPVRRGRLQAPALGVAVAAWDDDGHAVVGERGELVVTEPMPSMPLFLWNDRDGRRMHDSYFVTYPGVWRHGDFISFDPDGSSVILGRSDSTLNRNGIRMGSAEIYAIVERLEEVAEAMVIGVEQGDEAYYMPLFVTLADGADADATRAAITAAIRRQLSPRHVPDAIIIAPGIPHTRTGKKLEVPVKRLLQGRAPSEVLDRASVDAPELVDFYVSFAEAHLRAATTDA